MSNTEQTGATEATESETQEVEQQEVSATDENTEGTEQQSTEESEQANKDADLPEWARNELTRVRAEAADRRVALREAQDALGKAKTPEEFDAATKEFTEKIAVLERSLLVKDIASDFDLPPALAARLTGSTEEELRADAKLLAQFAPANEEPEALSGGLNPSDSDGSFDPVAASRKARQSRY